MTASNVGSLLVFLFSETSRVPLQRSPIGRMEDGLRLDRKAPYVLVEDSSGQRGTPLVHYQYLNEPVPRYISESRVMVLDLLNSSTLDRAFEHDYETGHSNAVRVVPKFETNTGDDRCSITLDGSFSDILGDRSRETKKQPPLYRAAFRAELVRATTNPFTYIKSAVEHTRGSTIGGQLFQNPHNGRIVQILEGPTDDIKGLLLRLKDTSVFTKFDVIQEGFINYPTISGCHDVKDPNWIALDQLFPRMSEWMEKRSVGSTKPMYDEFSSRSEHIRTLLCDKDLKGLSSSDLKGLSSASVRKPELAENERHTKPEPLNPTNIPETIREGLEKYTISGYFPHSHREGSPPIRVSRENLDGPPVILAHDKEEASGRHLFASPPRMMSPMPWAQTNGLGTGFSPVPLGPRIMSHNSNASEQVDLQVYVEQFDHHMQQCMKNAMATFKTQMEELAESYRRTYISKLQSRQPFAAPQPPKSPSLGNPHNSFPFARTLSESRKLENARRAKN